MMKMDDFLKKYQTKSKSINKVVDRWIAEKELDDLFGTEIAAGIILGDALTGDGLIDIVPDEVFEAFKILKNEKYDTIAEIKEKILEEFSEGDRNLQGLVSSIQGKIGENIFAENVGDAATLSKGINQEGYDVIVDNNGVNEYIQVKVYENANGVMKKMREVQDKVLAGEITAPETGEVVSEIKFAVNSDIFKQVSEKAGQLEVPIEVIDIGSTHEEIVGFVDSAVENVVNPFEHFFSEILGGAVKGAALHSAVNAFLVWKGLKEKNQAIEDTFYSTGTSFGGYVAGLGTEAIALETIVFLELETAAAILAGPVGALTLAGVGLTTRSILKRITNRRFLVKDIEKQNENINKFILKYGA